ncbi:MAG TPA: DUF6056 family protein [Flavobacterium sp.]|uniref:DUF6056 family protein n=1 Tax=unclassified Flavobacterium TaxID=196869 RepID=UPI0025B801F6|nr:MULTISPECIES: DUF6056 family protein [unclassified Flavobacterium]HRE79334.1 DUF6056 family protein [Flavobacterium sp.]
MIKQFKQLNPIQLLYIFIFSYTILPFLVLCFYNVPLGDDFWYAESFRTNGFWQTQLNFYHQWSGRYIATAAISTLNPISFGCFNLSFIHPLLLILGFAIALYHFIKNVVVFFRLTINPSLLFCLLFFFYFNYLPDFGETFYWMAGAYTYQLPIVFFLVYLNSILNLFNSNSKVEIVKNQFIALFSLFIVLGSNEVIVVYANFVNVLLVLILILNKNYFNRFSPIFIIAFIISFLMITAPGNFGRGSLFVKSDFHFLKSSLHSLSRSLFVLFFWVFTLLTLLLCLPNNSAFKIDWNNKLLFLLKTKRMFLMVSLVFLIGVLFVGFFPSIFTTNWIPQRAYTPIFFIFTLFATLLILFSIQKIKVLADLNKVLSTHKVLLVLIPILIITLSHNSNVMNAYVDITSGKASSYHKQVLETYEMLKNSKTDTVYVKTIKKKPLILPYRWPGENRLVNGEWEKYYKIKRIELSRK